MLDPLNLHIDSEKTRVKREDDKKGCAAALADMGVQLFSICVCSIPNEFLCKRLFEYHIKV